MIIYFCAWLQQLLSLTVMLSFYPQQHCCNLLLIVSCFANMVGMIVPSCSIKYRYLMQRICMRSCSTSSKLCMHSFGIAAAASLSLNTRDLPCRPFLAAGRLPAYLSTCTALLLPMQTDQGIAGKQDIAGMISINQSILQRSSNLRLYDGHDILNFIQNAVAAPSFIEADANFMKHASNCMLAVPDLGALIH